MKYILINQYILNYQEEMISYEQPTTLNCEINDKL